MQFQIVSNGARSNACFRDIIFKNISVVVNRFKYYRMHALETLFSFVSLQFQLVSNTIRIHALETPVRKVHSCISLYQRLSLSVIV